jgi:hypothetical protein
MSNAAPSGLLGRLARVTAMADRDRIRIAALASALFIGGLSLAGIGLRHHPVARSTGAVQARSPAANVAPVTYDDEGGEGDAD